MLAIASDFLKGDSVFGSVWSIFNRLGVETVTADLLLHGGNNGSAVGVNVEFGTLLFLEEQRIQPFLPVPNA